MDEEMNDGLEVLVRHLRDDNQRLETMCQISEQMNHILNSMANECKCHSKHTMDTHLSQTLDGLRVKYRTLKEDREANGHHCMPASLDGSADTADDDDEDNHSMCGEDSSGCHKPVVSQSGKLTPRKTSMVTMNEDITHHSFESIVDSIDAITDNHNNYLITIEGIDDTFYRDPTQDVKLEFVLPPMDDQLVTATIETETHSNSMTGADVINDLIDDRTKPSNAKQKTTNGKKSNNKSKANPRSKSPKNADKTLNNVNNINNCNNNRNCNRVKCEWPGCSLEFRDKYNLSVHMVRHTGEKSFQCKSAGCTKTYATKAALDVHQNTHSDNRRFKCNECDAAFIRKTQLTVHVSDKHTGQKPFRCNWPGCEYQACYLNRLQSHKLRHTGEKPYKCSQCEWTFRLSHHLKTHMLKHTGERPHECPHTTCDKRFQSKQAMRTHFKRTHTK